MLSVHTNVQMFNCWKICKSASAEKCAKVQIMKNVQICKCEKLFTSFSDKKICHIRCTHYTIWFATRKRQNCKINIFHVQLNSLDIQYCNCWKFVISKCGNARTQATFCIFPATFRLQNESELFSTFPEENCKFAFVFLLKNKVLYCNKLNYFPVSLIR